MGHSVRGRSREPRDFRLYELETPVANDYLSVGGLESISSGQASQDVLYKDAVAQYGPSIERLASACEADPEKRRDLSQDGFPESGNVVRGDAGRRGFQRRD